MFPPLSLEIHFNFHNSDAKCKVKSFWTKSEGVLICNDEQLKGTGIKDAHHIVHYTIPKDDFRTFLFRFSAFLDSYESGSDTTECVSSSILLSVSIFWPVPMGIAVLKCEIIFSDTK